MSHFSVIHPSDHQSHVTCHSHMSQSHVTMSQYSHMSVSQSHVTCDIVTFSHPAAAEPSLIVKSVCGNGVSDG
jgi:hypothetical protein